VTKILVVDDNLTNRKLVAALLSHDGFHAVEASDGADGLLAARRELPQLVISDILMPSMDGYEFVRRLRADPELKDTPVIFYTANYHAREAQSLAEKCHVARVLVKPCDAGSFLKTVNEVLAGTAQTLNRVDADFDVEHLRVLTDKLSETAEDLKRANGRFAALSDLNVQLASERDPRRLLEQVCSGARTLLCSKFAVLAVADPSGEGVLFFNTSGVAPGETRALIPKIDAGALGKVFKERVTLRLSKQQGDSVCIGLPDSYPAAEAIVAAPICSLKRTFGWLCLVEKVGGEEFSAQEERLLSILCAQAGRIYENGSLYAELQSHAAQLLVEMDERERAHVSLRASEEQFRQLAECIEDVFFIASADLLRTLYVSPAYERIWGRATQELMNDPNSWQRSVHSDDRDRVRIQLQCIAQDLVNGGELEYRIVQPGGTVRWILSRFFPILDDVGNVIRAVGVSTEVTERKLAEARILHLNRVHAMLSGINSLIVRATDRGDLFREACRLATEVGRFRVAWCGLLDGASREILPVATSGDGAELTQNFRLDLAAEAARYSLVARAVSTLKPAVCNDLRDTGVEILNRTELFAKGYRAVVALPLIMADRVVGCLALVSEEPNVFDSDEMRLLSEFAGDISFALDHIEKTERLNYLAYYDALTGLANRGLFYERLAQRVSVAVHGGPQFALLIADPEKLETINSTFGRSVGDQLLRELATRFTHCVGGAELVARIGSDRLAAVIAGSVEVTDLARVVDEIWREWLGSSYTISGHEIRLTAKAGIAIFPVDGADAETLVQHAEAALRNSKGMPSPYAFYTSHLSEQLVERLSLENDLRSALEQDQFVLHYQPKVDLDRRKITGLEALIRWASPTRGLIPPVKFIPLLEENGMIVDVGAWVIRRACADRQIWLRQNLAVPRIAVNVSTAQLRRDDFVKVVADSLRGLGTQAGIDIEVTESLLMDGAAENIATLNAVRELGVGIALDDFGTGYSSLGYLTRLPVKTLKIDRSFVGSMLDDPGAMTLVSTIISLARSMKLDTVAEGVESEEQAKILRLLRCDEMQGYLISKPLSFTAMTEFLQRGALA
jgi:diguanylate cyclase (GGDEF)-like protein/PAS domain S-box-containing protein